jgi:murein DD-endopeptidase MepM/ murein hydrolase activator NlpD
VKGTIGLRRSGPGCIALSVVLVFGAALPHAPSELTISAHARAIQPGEAVRLEVSCACTPSQRPGTARVFGREIPLVAVPDAAAWSGLIGIDAETTPGTYPVSVVVESGNARPLSATYTLNIITKRFPSRRLRVAPAYVDPPPAERDRIVADAQRLNALFAKTTSRERVGPFQAPVGVTPGNTFGSRSIFNGQPRSPHAGVDFGSPTGTPIAAPAAAVVVLADDLFFTGLTVVLDHGRGLYSVLAHLSTIAVTDGDVVKRGDVVGEVGATGRVTGPHLHWSTRLNEARVDPMSLLEVLAAER